MRGRGSCQCRVQQSRSNRRRPTRPPPAGLPGGMDAGAAAAQGARQHADQAPPAWYSVIDKYTGQTPTETLLARLNLNGSSQSEAVASKIATSHSPGIAVARQPAARIQGCQNPTPNAHSMRGIYRNQTQTLGTSESILPLKLQSPLQRLHAPVITNLITARRLHTRVDQTRETGLAVALAEPSAPPASRWLPSLRQITGALCVRRPASGTLTPKSARTVQTSQTDLVLVHVLNAGEFWARLVFCKIAENPRFCKISTSIGRLSEADVLQFCRDCRGLAQSQARRSAERVSCPAILQKIFLRTVLRRSQEWTARPVQSPLASPRTPEYCQGSFSR